MMQIFVSRISRTIVAVGLTLLLNACYETTPLPEVRSLVDDGYSISWTKQRGEYWDEFRAQKEKKKSEVILINRKNVKRDSNLDTGIPNTVELKEDGTFVVTEGE